MRVAYLEDIAHKRENPKMDLWTFAPFWQVKNDSRDMWATWSVYENGVRQGSFYHEQEARDWIKRAEFFRQRNLSGHEKPGHWFDTNTNGFNDGDQT